MKNHLFFSMLAMFTLPLFNTGCQKENLILQEPTVQFSSFTYLPQGRVEENGGLDILVMDEMRSTFKNEKSDCRFNDCEEITRALIDYYTPIVKSSCEEFTTIIECCREGYPNYAYIRIIPPPTCRHSGPLYSGDSKGS